LQFSPELFDLVTALDIFEHIEDDKKAFSESRRVLKKKGTLLLTVPANSCLWSHHDIALSHKRRYALSELKRKLVLSGFKIERISYCIFFLFLPIFLFRMVQKIYFEVSLFPPKTVYLIFPKFINTVFLWLCELENLLIKIGVNFPFGVSIVCVATKN
jgi:SAM-dependent methyltransferase